MKTAQEWKDAFDMMYNNSSNKAPELDSYEISLLLTEAQEDIIKAYFNPKKNKVLEGADMSSERETAFASITKLYKYEPKGGLPISKVSSKLFPKGFNITIENEIMFILNIIVNTSHEGSKSVVPLRKIDFNEYHRLMSRPYKNPPKGQGWYLITDFKDFEDTKVTNVDICYYPYDSLEAATIKYIVKPKPIIVEQLDDGLFIEGYNTPMPCELDSIVHFDILKRAVELGNAYYKGDLNSTIVIGNNSQTDLGVVPQSK